MNKVTKTKSIEAFESFTIRSLSILAGGDEGGDPKPKTTSSAGTRNPPPES